MTQSKDGPVLIELPPGAAPPSPAQADAILDGPDVPQGQAMQAAALLAARRGSTLARWFWRLLLALATFALSLWAWRAIEGLIASVPILGYLALGLTLAFLAVCAALIIKELAALSRLSRLDRLQSTTRAALASGKLAQAQQVQRHLTALYAARPELTLGRERLAQRAPEVMDADALIGLAEAQLLAPLDQLAQREVEAAARQVATVTALVPIALADVAAALTANLRMIRRIAEIYGGRAGTLGAWRLTRAVFSHLIATGAVAVGDDLISSVAGGGILSRVSRRFGEGLINGALTARVGVAAIEVCRPMPFHALTRPSVGALVKRALTGLFDRTS